jgi:hypothetical protein
VEKKMIAAAPFTPRRLVIPDTAAILSLVGSGWTDKVPTPSKRNTETSEIEPDDPITLKDACRIAFHDKIKVASLRAEAERGHLTTFRIGKRDFTTLRNVKQMIERKRKCPPVQKDPGFTSTPGASNGSSDMDSVSSARGALRETAKGLKKLSTNISPKVVNLSRRRPR